MELCIIIIIIILNIQSKNGIGIEYYDNEHIHFQGEFFEGLKWNGIIYNYNGEKEFEIKNGNGFGREYDYYGKLIFKGEFRNGKVWNGRGIEYPTIDELYGLLSQENIFYGFNYNKGEVEKNIFYYTGDYLEGEQSGKGEEYNWEKKLIFDGEFLKGKRHGKGKLYNDNNILIFEDEFFE